MFEILCFSFYFVKVIILNLFKKQLFNTFNKKLLSLFVTFNINNTFHKKKLNLLDLKYFR